MQNTDPTDGNSPDKLDLLAQMLMAEDIDLLQTQTIYPQSNRLDLPLSFAQQRLWFLDQLMAGSPVYNVPSALRLRGPLDLGLLEESINAIVRRHEVLRTTFTAVGGRPIQVIAPVLRVALPLVELRDLPQAERDAAISRLIVEEARRPFDLQHGPLIRTTLLRPDAATHILLLTMHHIVADGWSCAIFERELMLIYNAFAAGQPVPLPELPIQYADFAAWQREWFQGPILAEQLNYWKQQMAGTTPVLQLPTDRTRPAVQTYRGTYQLVALPAPLTDDLKALSQREGTTLFMTLLAALQTLLLRYTGQDDILIGSPITNRTIAETEGLIGFFANTLVLRTDLGGNPTFRTLLGRVREVCLGAYDHQDLPFEQLVEMLQPARNLSYSPLFQVMLAFQTEPAEDVQLAGLQLERLLTNSETAKFDLTFSFWDLGHVVSGMLEYNSDLFDASTIARMFQHFQMLLTGIVANPDERLALLPLVGATEHQQLLGWNNPPALAPGDAVLHQLFEQQVLRTPDAIAVVFDPGQAAGDQRASLSGAVEQLSYAALNRHANQVAHRLRALGVGPDVLVGLCVERTSAMVVAILGILKAGGAYLPLDPMYPEERLRFMLRDAGITVLVTEQQMMGKLDGSGARVLCLDSDQAGIAQEPLHNPVGAAASANLAYVIYTSGSTGRPKGVLIPHSTVVRLFTATDSWYHFEPRDVWTLFHSYAFDFSVWELWGALLYGGRLVVVPYLVSRAPEVFYRLLDAEQVTVLNQTPSAFRQLIQVDQEAGEDGTRLALRYVIFGGEALDLGSLRPWIERHGDQAPQLINMYGITETTVHVTYRPISAADLAGTQGSLIGRQIPDLQIYVLDSHRQLAPIGAPGEIYVGGAGLARGYLHRPELTAERFVPSSVVRCKWSVATDNGQRTTDNGQPAVQDRRPGALPGRWDAGIPGTDRPAGQGARFSDRVRRDRSGPDVASGGARGDRARTGLRPLPAVSRLPRPGH